MLLNSYYSLDFVLLMRVQSESILLRLKCDRIWGKLAPTINWVTQLKSAIAFAIIRVV
jgi:hypothetical protein